MKCTIIIISIKMEINEQFTESRLSLFTLHNTPLIGRHCYTCGSAHARETESYMQQSVYFEWERLFATLFSQISQRTLQSGHKLVLWNGYVNFQWLQEVFHLHLMTNYSHTLMSELCFAAPAVTNVVNVTAKQTGHRASKIVGMVQCWINNLGIHVN